ncbi:MAG: 16S rRNA (guanine(966)-N(2))-methyltransferase RsmD [Desulfobacteraceae bacterium]|nr:16S rRNA (guanine(966)-N(2))-methyltransferase RsmD [Desulfobacteraceae bacterium]
MRIISGQWRGKTLRSVKGMATRPTSDRVRESLFNILSLRIRDANVLDLFAGTGALGIEALSRGAKSAVFVDESKEALSVIRKNLEDCRLQNNARVIRWNIALNLNCLKAYEKKFDLVFMDPPYHSGLIAPALTHLTAENCLADSACIVIEHDISETISEAICDFYLADQRKYGRTFVSFLNTDKLKEC